MPYKTIESKFHSMRGWKRPLYSYTRVFHTRIDVCNRIKRLEREWGEENIAHMPSKTDSCAEIVYIRVV